MSYTSNSLEPLTIKPKNGDGTGTVDISGTIIADIVYSPGMVVRMAHDRQDPLRTTVIINGVNTLVNIIDHNSTFTPISISSESTIICEAYFNYYNFGYANDSYIVTLSGINESTPNARDSCDIISYNYSGGGGRRSGRPLIITKDISANTSTPFSVSLKSIAVSADDILQVDSKITFIFSQVAK